MNYPVWDVPHLGSGLVIALIAIFHIMIAHFAVGGGLFLPLAEAIALRQNRQEWLAFLPQHSKFFLILTGVFGAVSGVGIWFSIGLASPEGTSTLIHNFVFGWAIEWVFFIVELTTVAVYYYTWGRIPDRLHLQVGWLYAVASFATLVIINGILTFMLTPGQAWLSVAGTGQEPGMFFRAFFNPTYWPSLALRTLSCVALAGVWALVTGSRIDGRQQPVLKRQWIRWSALWLVPGFLLMPVCLWWYVSRVPAEQLQLLQLGISTIGAGTFTQVTRTLLVSVMASATILAVAYLAAYRKPEQFRLGGALTVLLLGLTATGSAEMARELLRKPYVVVDYMYSNGVRKVAIQRDGQTQHELERFNQDGYLARSPWVRAEERQAWNAETAGGGAGDLTHAGEMGLARGELMFRGQCLACHTVDGYRSMRRLLHDRNEQAISNIVAMLHKHEADSPYRAFMPPLVGTQAERDALAAYLNYVAHGQAETNSAGL
ncbi:MAG: hypothetical protein GXY58_17725 [Planctomycetaceae bacterium]|nr:hypothetical protein [Planctomycetaceae bacterium]